MFRFIRLSFGLIVRIFRPRSNLLLENLVLRQQASVLKRKNRRPKLTRLDRCFWIPVRQVWSGWKSSLMVVKPETVVGWHRRGIRLYWRLKSRTKQVGRAPITPELQQLVSRIATENPTWGAPRIHGELRMLGLDVGERTISRWMQRQSRKPDPGQRWLAFLSNHREAIAAMDFFTVPTLTFRVLYAFFVIEHHRRRILHFNATAHPTSEWIVQQLREALPLPCPYRYVVFDRDRKFGADALTFLKASGIKAVRTSIRSPWQNGVAESHLSCSSQVPFERAVGLHLLARTCAKGDPRRRRLST